MAYYTKLIENIPDYKAFMTVDEMDASSKKLAEEYPDIVTCFEAGKSTKGNPIYCLKIGNGPKNALMFGLPHPNEPIGAMMLEYFSRALAEDDKLREELGYTWYMIKSIDLDGTKLNEKWFKGPFTLTNFARNYFRPASECQAEWTFPINYKKYSFNEPISETQTLMRLIDEIKPAFMYSLHNSKFGGAYWYITKDIPEIWESLHNAAHKQNIPLHLGEPEINYIVPFAPAIFPMISRKDTYDYNEKFSKESPEKTIKGGTSSSDYALTNGYGTVTLVNELPYFYDARIMSDKPMGFTRREAALKRVEFNYESSMAVKQLYDQVAHLKTDDNGFWKMISSGQAEHMRQQQTKFINESPDYDPECKESEAFDTLDIPKFTSLLSWTLLIRGCEYEMEKDWSAEEKELLKKIHDEAEAEFNKRAEIAERDLVYEVIPIKKLISIQLESGMIVADWVKNNM